MPSSTTTNYIEIEGTNLLAKQKRLSSTSIEVSWIVPKNPMVYNGVIVVCSPVELNPSNFPTDGVRYNGSSDFSVISDQIGLAQVVGAFYDDLVTNTVVITNLEPNKAYYIAVHLNTNIYTYYQVGAKTYPVGNATSVYAGAVQNSYDPPTNPKLGQSYFDPSQNMMFAWSGVAWVPTKEQTTITGEVNPVAPFSGLPTGYPGIGDFFYNTRLQSLVVWNGIGWDNSESPKGEPSYSTIGVGTTGEQAPRETIKDILKHQLGYPVVCVELQDVHFDIALNNALQTLRSRASSAYYKQYFFLTVLAGQDVFYFNDPTTGTRNIVDIIKIHRLNVLGLSSVNGTNMFAQQVINQFFAPGQQGIDLVSVHLVNSMSEMYAQLFASEVAFSWREASREMRIFRRFTSTEKVLVESSMEKSEQEILTDRWTQQWIQQWAMSELYSMLANIRGKFTTLPGPGGGLSLNADSLISQASVMREDCLRQIKDFEIGTNGPDNFYSPFLMG
jgi:hypothetical protein